MKRCAEHLLSKFADVKKQVEGHVVSSFHLNTTLNVRADITDDILDYV